MSSFRKSCFPSVALPELAAGPVEDADGVVMDWIMRSLLSASRPHVETVAGAHRASGGHLHDSRQRGGNAVGTRRERRRVVGRELAPGRVEPEVDADVSGDEPLL